MSKRSNILVLAVLAGTGCTDRVTTLTDPDYFPGSLPTTIQYTLPSEALLGSMEVVPGRTTIKDAFFKLIAQDFDESLSAHLVAQFNGFPRAVEIGGVSDSSYTYESSRVVASLPDTLRVSQSVLEFQLWTITQPFDSLDVTWQNAIDRPGETVAWSTAGGTRGQLLATDTWRMADTGTGADSLTWEVPAEVVSALADSSLAGLMVVLNTPTARAEISSLAIEANVRSETRDTVVTQIVHSLAQTYIYTPEPELPADLLRVGGLTSDRTLFQLRLDNPLQGCAVPTPDCPAQLNLDEVILNRVELVLEPAPVTRGFRPIARTRLTFRRLLEPELGPRATLGEVVAGDTVSVSRFLPSNTQPLVFNLTNMVSAALANGDDELAFAVLIEPQASTPSYVWMQRNPRLRFTYTLPQRPQLP